MLYFQCFNVLLEIFLLKTHLISYFLIFSIKPKLYLLNLKTKQILKSLIDGPIRVLIKFSIQFLFYFFKYNFNLSIYVSIIHY